MPMMHDPTTVKYWNWKEKWKTLDPNVNNAGMLLRLEENVAKHSGLTRNTFVHFEGCFCVLRLQTKTSLSGNFLWRNISSSYFSEISFVWLRAFVEEFFVVVWLTGECRTLLEVNWNRECIGFMLTLNSFLVASNSNYIILGFNFLLPDFFFLTTDGTLFSFNYIPVNWIYIIKVINKIYNLFVIKFNLIKIYKVQI